MSLSIFAPVSITSQIHDDKDRLYMALYGVGEGDFCAARSLLMRTIITERMRGMIPNDAFDSMVALAGRQEGRKCLFAFFRVSVPEGVL
ncbi:MAG: hypothetical protein FD131_3346 [Rhodocyclaceae bacterium]|nr:MAG: hypothetical protein FD131_3346 [Rhodocyclaceae bacterium]